MTDKASARRLPVAKIAIAVVIVAALVASTRLLPVGRWLAEFQTWVTALGPAGWAVYALVYALCCVLFVPASILTLGAGAVYGLWTGTCVVLAGATLGAVLSFVLARTVLRSRVEAWTSDNPRFVAFDRAVARDGAKIVLLVRLSPVFPFTFINYAFGLSGVSFPAYLAATMIGMIPGTVAYVYLGVAAASAVGGSAGGAKLAIQIVGAIAAVAVTLLVAKIARNAIAGAMAGDR